VRLIAAQMSVVLFLSTVTYGAARAEDPVARARAYYKSGQAHYDAGEYLEALGDFEAGYDLSKKPQFLVNMGQAHRKLGHLESARENYARFLAETSGDSPVRTEVQQVIADIDRELAARQPPRPSPPPAAVPPPPTVAPTVTASAAAPAEALHAAPARRGFAQRNWWIFPAAAVVLGAVAVGIYFGVRPADQVHCGDAMVFGCINAR
jgi:tetratricopeptide (TPR) repeat protein